MNSVPLWKGAIEPSMFEQPVVTPTNNWVAYSDWQGNPKYTLMSGASGVPFAGTDPDGGQNAYELDMKTTGFPRLQQIISQTSLDFSGDIVGSYWVKKAVSDAADYVRITTNNAGAWSTGFSTKLALTNDWQRIEMSPLLIVDSNNCAFMIGGLDEHAVADLDCQGKVLIAFFSVEAGRSVASDGHIVTYNEVQRTNTPPSVPTFIWKGAVEPAEQDFVGLPANELDLPVGLENQVIPIQLVGSTILKIDEFNSSQVIVDREFAVKTELWNSNTTIKVD